MVFNIEYENDQLYNQCEEHLNLAEAFCIIISELKIVSLIKKYPNFFKSNDVSSTPLQLSLKFHLFHKTKIIDLYIIYTIALQYGYRIDFREEDEQLKVIFNPINKFNRYQFFTNIDRSTFPVMDYPSKNFYVNAKNFCENNKYLVVRVQRIKDVDNILVESLEKQNIIESTKIIYPIYLKMFLDHVTQILNWNIIFFIENRILYILCSSLTSHELINERV